MKGTGSLILAAAYASWAVVEALLDMGADPGIRTTIEHFNAMHFASTTGRPLTIANWATRYIDWDWEARASAIGVTAMLCGVFWGPDKVSTVRALLDVGADPLYRAYSGVHILGSIASNLDSDAELTRFALSIPGVRQLVDEPIRATTIRWMHGAPFGEPFSCDG